MVSAILRSLPCHLNFRISLSRSTKITPCWDSTGISWKPINQFCGGWDLTLDVFGLRKGAPGPAGMEDTYPQPCVAARTLYLSPLLGVLGLPGVVRATQQGRVVPRSPLHCWLEPGNSGSEHSFSAGHGTMRHRLQCCSPNSEILTQMTLCFSCFRISFGVSCTISKACGYAQWCGQQWGDTHQVCSGSRCRFYDGRLHDGSILNILSLPPAPRSTWNSKPHRQKKTSHIWAKYEVTASAL